MVCLLVGLLQLFVWQTGRVELRGGPVTVGLYGAALQLVLSLLAVAVVDDLRPGATWGVRRRRRRVGWRDVATRPVGFARSFSAFYLRFFLPVAALAFGVGVSVTAVVFALLPWEVAVGDLYDTTVVLGGLWLLGTAAMVAARAAPPAVAGFVVGLRPRRGLRPRAAVRRRAAADARGVGHGGAGAHGARRRRGAGPAAPAARCRHELALDQPRGREGRWSRC